MKRGKFWRLALLFAGTTLVALAVLARGAVRQGEGGPGEGDLSSTSSLAPARGLRGFADAPQTAQIERAETRANLATRANPEKRAQASRPASGRKAERRARQAGQTAERLALQHPLAHLKSSDFPEIIARPLFSPSRRPPPKPRPVVARPAPRPVVRKSPVRFELLGILREPKQAVALLVARPGGLSYVVRQGDMMSGWKVARIAAREVTLEKNEQTITLKLPD